MVYLTAFFSLIIAFGIALNMRSAAGGIEQGRLAPCPNQPSCVCSQDVDPQHAIDPLIVKVENPIAEIAKVIDQMPRTKIIKQTSNYLHATFRSKIFQFLDDVEFYYLPEEGVVHVRSSSRVGYSDLGVNRDRVETIRIKLLNNI